jgi:3-ketosteroid 9alpha-monooxygenase subunit A
MEACMGERDEVRVIDAGPVPDRFARGWHCLGLADGFRDGRPHAVHAFGTKLVVFADSTGTLVVLDAYCRHMGGDLSMGTVKGDAVACPFHDWRWSGDGRCRHIPYAKRVPPRARTRAWPTLEENRQLFVWHDPQGNPPTPEVTIPRIEGAFSQQWSAWSWDSLVIEGSHCREVMDNVVDMAHFFYIHFGFPTYFKNVFEGHVAAQYLATRGRPDMSEGAYAGDATLRSDAAYYGPSYMIDNLYHDYHGLEVHSVLVNCHYPITPTSFVLQWGIIVKRLPGLTTEQADKVARRMSRSIGVGFLQDVEIWKHKSKVDNPLLCAEDGPVYQLRRWYDQFYVDVEDVTEEMVARFEYEVDTTAAIKAWETEVAQNLARREAETAVKQAAPS